MICPAKQKRSIGTVALADDIGTQDAGLILNLSDVAGEQATAQLFVSKVRGNNGRKPAATGKP